MTLSGFLPDGKRFEKVLELSDGHSHYGKILHSAFVVAASEHGALNYIATVQLARELNLVTRYTSLLLYDNSTKHERVDKITVDIPVLSRFPAFAQLKASGFKMKAERKIVDKDGSRAPEKVGIADLQSASGAWADLAKLCELIGKPVPQGQWAEDEMATALAVEALRAQGKAQFAPIMEKGVKWLIGKLGDKEAKTILSWAVAVLAA
jgi:hypothetical protein